MATSLPPIDWEAESYPGYPDFAAIPFFVVFFLAVRFVLDHFVFEVRLHSHAFLFLVQTQTISLFARVGSVVLAIHDATDVFLEVAKISKYSGHNLLADVSFLVFVISWL
nr:unnamed protein product [Digitaria exilis]